MKHPTKSELEFLELSYNQFYDLYDEILDDKFWSQEAFIRFYKIKQIFSIYSELLNYEPIKEVIKYLKVHRPPMESEIGSELFRFVRNVVSHFPFFESWEDVWVNKSLINWYRDGLSIDKFLEKYKAHKEIKYRFWEEDKKKMTYLSIRFPKIYDRENKIFLKDIISEKDGVKFSIILMRKILDSQVEKTIKSNE